MKIVSFCGWDWLDTEWKPRAYLFWFRGSTAFQWSGHVPNSPGHLRKNMPQINHRGKSRSGQPRTREPFNGVAYNKYRQRALMRELLGEIVRGKLEYDALLVQSSKKRRPFTI